MQHYPVYPRKFNHSHEACKIFCVSKSFQILSHYFYSKTEMHQFLKFILFCGSTLHVSDGLSVHHQESQNVHTASGICQTDTADCLLAGTFPPASSQQYLFDTYLMLYVQSQTPDDGWKDRPKHVKCHYKIKKIYT